jgi:hypothetical protein
MKLGDLVFVVPDEYWKHDQPFEAKIVDTRSPFGTLVAVKKPGDEEVIEVPVDRVFWMRAVAQQSMRLLKQLRGLRGTDNGLGHVSQSLEHECQSKGYEDEPKSCKTCRYCDSWNRKNNPFPWMPKNTACYHRHPTECGPDADWQHWRTRNLREGEDYWTGRTPSETVRSSRTHRERHDVILMMKKKKNG